MEKWYLKTPDETIGELETSRSSGLTQKEASDRLEKYGTNELKEEKGKSLGQKILEQFKDPMIIVLLLASILSAYVGEIEDTFIILAIVLVNGILSIYQEGKAEEAIKALQQMSAPHAKVIRDGKTLEISSTELVPGDLVLLETGAIVPADIRLIDSSNLQIDESSLTGESVPVEKHADRNYDDTVEIGDRDNIAHSSTIITYGRGSGIVVGTGINTEIGKIASSLSSLDDEQTPLQKRLEGLSKLLAVLVLVICGVVFAVGLLHDMEFIEILMTSVSLAVAAIPEGLPAIVTIVLSLGMTRMAERNAIVKKLLAVETLGTTTVICSDKTGTLTQNEMTVKKAFVNGQIIEIEGTGYHPEGKFFVDDKEIETEEVSGLTLMMGIATLSNDSELNDNDGQFEIIGDPTEGSLLTFAEKAGIKKSEYNEKFPRVAEIPFDSDRKMMTTFHKEFFPDKIASLTKGAPDIVIERCSKILVDGAEIEFTDPMKEKIMEKNKFFARDALRVLAFAYNSMDELVENPSSDEIERDMVFVGLVGMIDPPRQEAKDAIQECKNAGIIPIMITGDHLDTAFAIGKELQIADSEDQAIMGRELNTMSDEELRQVVKTKRIFARVSPENKVQLVNALKENGEIVAMTGDGVNDAPAIKRADIGISMGITGTDVAKNTAEVILTDDNFATIVHAVEEGRIIYSNIKKFVSFLLSCNIGEVLIVFLAIVFNMPVPLTAKQLLWTNLVTDSFPALALGVEKGEEDIMSQPPRNPEEPILDRETTKILIIQSIGITITTLGAYIYGLRYFGDNLNGARTIAFTSLVMAELLRSYSARSDRYTLRSMGVFTNKKLVMATIFSFALTIAVIYIPGVNDLFDTVPLNLANWLVVLVASLVPLILGEAYKAIKNNK